MIAALTAREQFVADLGTWALYAAVAWVIARFVVAVVRAAAAEVHEGRRVARRTAFVIDDPMRYCLVGHVHAHRDDAAHCEAAHGYGDL